MKASPVIKQIVVAMILCLAALAQSPSSGMKHFSKDGLSFDYPAALTLEDKSSAQEQRLVLTRAGNSWTIVVQSPRELLSTLEEIVAARDSVTTAYVSRLSETLGVTFTPDWQHTRCTDVGNRKALGFRLEGSLRKQPTTGEVYVLIKGHRLVNLIFVRVDKEEAQASPVWRVVRETLKMDAPQGDAGPETQSDEMLLGGLLNRRAIFLDKPHFPGAARGQGVSGRVMVKVVVDTDGKVISARAVDGPTVFRENSEKAAMKSKFGPTEFCGTPARITGIITYNYVAQP
jgi:TonB family protein